MPFLHTLNELNMRAADNVSTFIIREIKKSNAFPINVEEFIDKCGAYFISEEEANQINAAIELAAPVSAEIKAIFLERSELHEPINLKRALNMMAEMPSPLMANLKYLMEIGNMRVKLLKGFADVVNSMPAMKSEKEMLENNAKLAEIFSRLLRTDDFFFNASDMVNEGKLSTITSLSSSMEKGFLFHVLLEEEINKVDFEGMKKRIPPEALSRVEKLAAKIAEVKKGAEAAYRLNMQAASLSLILYAYIKYAKELIKKTI